MSDPTAKSHVTGPRQSIRALVILGLVAWLLYAGVAWLSQRFGLETPGIERPIVEVLVLLTAAFAIYLLAILAAIRIPDRPEVSAIIVIFAVAFRLLLLFSEPIQEVDIYRYLWDGQVARCGVNPFRYTPQQVLETRRETRVESRERKLSTLARLVELRESSPAMREILSRVHFAELPTVYPPVSQVVFALAALTTPCDADVSTHVIVMKTWTVAFDVATILILLALLKLTAKPAGWSVAYAWCPLVLKEFANSGHLDSIAVCLTTLAIFLAVRSGLHQPAATNARPPRRDFLFHLGAMVALALAVGAKLYPVVLAPLLVILTARRFGWGKGVGALTTFVVVSTVVCWPMLGRRVPEQSPSHRVDHRVNRPTDPVSPAPPNPKSSDSMPPAPTAGLQAFLSRWKMNDFLFLIVIENLTPDQDFADERRPWFVAMPNEWRLHLTQRIQHSFPMRLREGLVPFLLARAATAAVFVLLAAWFAWRAYRNPSRFLESAFLTLAWFFLLLPTQNPWYWIWALPFVAFARGRAWLAVGGLVLAYYLRFWFAYHWPDSRVPPSTYRGELFFDYVVTWLEFAPWFAWLACSTIRRSVTIRTDRIT